MKLFEKRSVLNLGTNSLDKSFKSHKFEDY